MKDAFNKLPKMDFRKFIELNKVEVNLNWPITYQRIECNRNGGYHWHGQYDCEEKVESPFKGFGRMYCEQRITEGYFSSVKMHNGIPYNAERPGKDVFEGIYREIFFSNCHSMSIER